MQPEQQVQSQPPPVEQDTTEQPLGNTGETSDNSVRAELLNSLSNIPEDLPNLAADLYAQLGIPDPGVMTSGVRSLTQDLQPGDLVGWYGGHQPDGTYVGNMAVYAGDGEIIEAVPGGESSITRRRKIASNENCFGIPVFMPGDPTTPEAQA